MTTAWLAACAPTAEQPVPNVINYEIDGKHIEVDEGLAIGVVDETKHILGPNTHTFLEAGVLSAVPEPAISDKLRFNVPRGIALGKHDVSFAPLPSRESVWVSHNHSQSEAWIAYRGAVTLEQLDGVGGRLRASFPALDLINSCGQRRQLTNGELDVQLGAEDGFQVSKVDMSDTSEWAQQGATALIENNLMIQLDDKLVACPFVDFGPRIVPAADSGTGRDERVLEVIAVCSCDQGEPARRPPDVALVALLPISGQGDVIVNGSQYFLSVSVDVNRTPEDAEDDDLWFAVTAPHLRYRAVGSALATPIGIELAEPLSLLSVDGHPAKRLSVANLYGFVNRRLGQQARHRIARPVNSPARWPN